MSLSAADRSICLLIWLGKTNLLINGKCNNKFRDNKFGCFCLSADGDKLKVK